MTTLRGDNVGSHKIAHGAVDAKFEMQCFEELGPRARQAIIESPVKILAAPIVLDILAFEKEQREKIPDYFLDFQEPRLDSSIARGIQLDSLKVVCANRPKEDAIAGMRPLRARRTLTGRKIYR